MNILLRRRKLGRTSTRGISGKSRSGILTYLNEHRVVGDVNVLFRWGCTSEMQSRLTVNPSRAIHTVNDKKGFRELLARNDLAPRIWTITNVTDQALRNGVIFRPATHHQGRNIWLCHTRDLLRQYAARFPNHYISDYIRKTEEYRIFVVQGRVVCVARKTPANPDALAWNVFQGGRFDNVTFDHWPLKAIRKSIEAFNLSGLDFGGVDVMVDQEGNCFILEINSAPSLTSEYRQECFAKAFDYIVRHGKVHIPLIQERGDWKKFIHPAISERARV